ncbi:Dolichyldiphosphatase 1 [Hondaea fermentalgiana]|uniref:Dolichyldiphosphatase 1 n=1 Tax=Hondaea fermentalgiana TaxID=2315210 RepID=A0A2R5GE10_9STRA|nr:Dolichyldiphosphatase 1 [Hondaea fermentalgiana]|eukprot:GBG26034.1 Dolichyldiphosphatase 1 [Hondaea fermentalgiana]
MGGVLRKVLQTKYITAAATGLSLAYLRNGFMVRLLVGAGLNSVLSKVLKRVFDQPRPEKASESGKTDPGFPSSHAHMLFYLSVYTTLAIDAPGAPAWVPYLTLAYAFVGSVWRVFIERHTPIQVIAGIVSGSLGALLWYLAVPQELITKSDVLVHRAQADYPLTSLVVSLGSSLIAFGILKNYGNLISTPTRLVPKQSSEQEKKAE